MLLSLSGTDAPVSGDDGKGIPDEGIVAVVVHGSIEGCEGALEGLRVLGAMEDGRGICGATGTFSLRPDGILERDITLLRWVMLEKIREDVPPGVIWDRLLHLKE
ncbi:hypothetical protein AZE42_13411 [Rhizopogon vesiculosus]|uniref:Uncharacterized protein n=1 Tax=Rhizopogon vesiculosus TaxID=180088 RepID=A0A1J8Q1B2_9AGAM|nr:hypothetical protein AZE42_13411 [Rhizopogon vesiculosus]